MVGAVHALGMRENFSSFRLHGNARVYTELPAISRNTLFRKKMDNEIIQPHKSSTSGVASCSPIRTLASILLYYKPNEKLRLERNREPLEKQSRADNTKTCASNAPTKISEETAEPNASGARRPVNASSNGYTELVAGALRNRFRSGGLPHPPSPRLRPRPKYLKRVVDRRGVVRVYYARGGKPHIRLNAPEGTSAFLEAYEAARRAKAIQWRFAQRAIRTRRSMRDLVDLYQRSQSYARLSPHTQRVYDRVLHRLLHVEGMADSSASSLGRKRIQQLVDRHADAPAAAADLLKKLRILFRCAIDQGWRADDPTRGVRIGHGRTLASRLPG